VTFEVGVVAEFSATHHLVGDFGPAQEMHGHDYRVDVRVGGASLRQDGTLFDITVLQNALAVAAAALSGRDLNGLPAFANRNPTAEVVAQYFSDSIRPALAGFGLATLVVEIWESSVAYASYSADIT
jgi:6-pyruvoyltetrahydropterin/6-carboxytetrahydropterin synthase